MPKSICVYCSSSNHVDETYQDTAVELGRLIAEGGHRLVYGGGSIGLMGHLARSVHRSGGEVIGVIPESMMKPEVAYDDADELIVTETMRQRKQVMYERSDTFMALPGGFGTLEELMEVITLKQLRHHTNPVVLINTNGFYEPLLAFFEHLYETKFAKERYRAGYGVVAGPREALAYVDAHQC